MSTTSQDKAPVIFTKDMAEGVGWKPMEGDEIWDRRQLLKPKWVKRSPAGEFWEGDFYRRFVAPVVPSKIQACPVCGGRKWMPCGFFSGVTETTTCANEPCEICNATGTIALTTPAVVAGGGGTPKEILAPVQAENALEGDERKPWQVLVDIIRAKLGGVCNPAPPEVWTGIYNQIVVDYLLRQPPSGLPPATSTDETGWDIFEPWTTTYQSGDKALLHGVWVNVPDGVQIIGQPNNGSIRRPKKPSPTSTPTLNIPDKHGVRMIDGAAFNFKDGFICPECGGSHFGSTLEPETFLIKSRSCHDEFGKGCHWSGEYWMASDIYCMSKDLKKYRAELTSTKAALAEQQENVRILRSQDAEQIRTVRRMESERDAALLQRDAMEKERDIYRKSNGVLVDSFAAVERSNESLKAEITRLSQPVGMLTHKDFTEAMGPDWHIQGQTSMMVVEKLNAKLRSLPPLPPPEPVPVQDAFEKWWKENIHPLSARSSFKKDFASAFLAGQQSSAQGGQS